jgi:hypothetical protein
VRRTLWTTARRQRRVATRDSSSEREPPFGSGVDRTVIGSRALKMGRSVPVAACRHGRPQASSPRHAGQAAAPGQPAVRYPGVRLPARPDRLPARVYGFSIMSVQRHRTPHGRVTRTCHVRRVRASILSAGQPKILQPYAEYAELRDPVSIKVVTASPDIVQPHLVTE